MIQRGTILTLWAAISATAAVMANAAEPLEPIDSAPPATAPASTPEPIQGLRPSPTTPHPIESLPLSPSPVRYGGFVPETKKPMSFMSEGTFVYQRPAKFRVDSDGKAIIQFDPDPKQGKNAAPSAEVFVLPNLKRMAIEDAIRGKVLPLIVSGTATEFESHNYILLDDDTHPAGPPMAATAPSTVPQGTPASAKQPPTPTTDPKKLSADEMLGQLLRTAPGSAVARPAPLRWDQPPETDKSSGSGAIVPGAPGTTLIREGRYLPDRLGRLTRTPDGKTAEFTFDSDGKALRDPPLIIMPCGKLAQMQGTEVGYGLDMHFRISGTVTEYRGRNYLLPEKVVAVSNLSF